FKVVIQRTLMTCSQFVNDIVVKKFAVSHKNGIVKNEFNVRYQVCSDDHQRVWPHSRDDRIQSGVTSGRVDPADWLISMIHLSFARHSQSYMHFLALTFTHLL